MLEDKSHEREPKFRDEERREAGKDNGEVQEKIYDSSEYISRARRVLNGTVPINILQFQYPFFLLYNCKNNHRIFLFFLFESHKCLHKKFKKMNFGFPSS